MNVGSRPAAGSPGGNGDGSIMLEGVTGGQAVAGIKNAQPRVVRLSNELTASRSIPQGLANSDVFHEAVSIVFGRFIFTNF